MVRLGLLAVAVFAAACGNECDDFARCEGNVLVTCGAGPDQVVGRKLIKTPCTGANPVCVAVKDVYGGAVCAAEAGTSCAANRCEAGAALTCHTIAGASVLVATACTGDGGCESTDAGVACVP